MSIATAFVHELIDGIRHHRHSHDTPARTVPAAADWDDWHYADARAPWEDEH
ncbi:hypothetical protein [Nocardia spumae]|uniref:hypothetical protein n=1 Tax=Nocardia spumae TaxID=2887190 RepID=UPI001D13AB5B|nr:hypothetical protein [Nocardia spumae]